MRKEEHTILYCTILSAGQWDFLLDCKAAINRQKMPVQADDCRCADKNRPPYQGR